MKWFSYHAHEHMVVEYTGMSHHAHIPRVFVQNNHNRLKPPSSGAFSLPASPRYAALSPKMSAVLAKAIPSAPAMKAKWRGSLFRLCKIPSEFNYVVLGGTWRLLSPFHNISAFSMAQAGNILVPTQRSEERQISKPGLQHSWIS